MKSRLWSLSVPLCLCGFFVIAASLLRGSNTASSYVGSPNFAGATIQASAAQTATGTGSAAKSSGEWFAAVWQLDVTAAATAAGDTLDVYVQTTVDGTNWFDIVHFPQMLGNGGAKRYIMMTNAYVGELSGDVFFDPSAALPANQVQNIFGDQYRVRWVIASSSAPSFTFSVKANFK